MFNKFTSRVFVGLIFNFLPVQATDYTRMAQEIARESVPQRDASIGEARRFIESTKNQKYPSFFGFDDTKKEPILKRNEVLQPKEYGKTCRTAKMGSDIPKARYQGDSGLYILVSLSLPDKTLKTLSQQAKDLGANLVIQGLVNNSFKETQKRMRELSIPIDIDPTLFERFDVKRIPTFVLTEIKDGDIQGPYDKVTGNVSVRSALELFAIEGELVEPAKALLQKRRDAQG